MEVSEDRGIECQGVCFNLVDGKIVLAVYQNLPGIKRDLAGTTFLRAFEIDDWLVVNRFLKDMVGDVEMRELILGDVEEKEEEEEEVPTIHSERRDLSVPNMTNNEEEEEGNDGQE
ncbi:MAG: hypothetical protein QQN63_10085 [Nitrosopumilus sp.]